MSMNDHSLDTLFHAATQASDDILSSPVDSASPGITVHLLIGPPESGRATLMRRVAERAPGGSAVVADLARDPAPALDAPRPALLGLSSVEHASSAWRLVLERWLREAHGGAGAIVLLASVAPDEVADERPRPGLLGDLCHGLQASTHHLGLRTREELAAALARALAPSQLSLEVLVDLELLSGGSPGRVARTLTCLLETDGALKPVGHRLARGPRYAEVVDLALLGHMTALDPRGVANVDPEAFKARGPYWALLRLGARFGETFPIHPLLRALDANGDLVDDEGLEEAVDAFDERVADGGAHPLVDGLDTEGHELAPLEAYRFLSAGLREHLAALHMPDADRALAQALVAMEVEAPHQPPALARALARQHAALGGAEAEAWYRLLAEAQEADGGRAWSQWLSSRLRLNHTPVEPWIQAIQRECSARLDHFEPVEGTLTLLRLGQDLAREHDFLRGQMVLRLTEAQARFLAGQPAEAEAAARAVLAMAEQEGIPSMIEDAQEHLDELLKAMDD
jgi:hypothetical protein